MLFGMVGFKTRMGLLYSASVRPSPAFGALVWRPTTEDDWEKKLLENIQRLACTAMTGHYHTTR